MLNRIPKNLSLRNLPKLWAMEQQHLSPWELVRNAKSQASDLLSQNVTRLREFTGTLKFSKSSDSKEDLNKKI